MLPTIHVGYGGRHQMKYSITELIHIFNSCNTSNNTSCSNSIISNVLLVWTTITDLERAVSSSSSTMALVSHQPHPRKPWCPLLPMSRGAPLPPSPTSGPWVQCSRLLRWQVLLSTALPEWVKDAFVRLGPADTRLRLSRLWIVQLLLWGCLSLCCCYRLWLLRQINVYWTGVLDSLYLLLAKTNIHDRCISHIGLKWMTVNHYNQQHSFLLRGTGC